MNDIFLLEKIFLEIQRQNKLPDLKLWTNSTYSDLSEQVYAKTNVLLSRNTLKNIVKKILISDIKYSPQATTKNALAAYMGYESWKSFKDKADMSDFKYLEQYKKSKVFSVKKIIIPGAISLFCIVIAILFVNKKSLVTLVNKTYDYTLSVSDTVGKAPHTITIDYDFSNVHNDSILLDLDTYSAAGKYELKELPNKKGVENFCYHHPGLYQMRLFINGELDKTQKILIKSDGWRATVYDAQVNLDNVPKISLKYHDLNFFYSPFDNVITSDFIEDGFMCVTPKIAGTVSGLPKNYKTEYSNYRFFNIDGDNLKFKVGFFHNNFGKETFCYSAQFTLVGTHNNLIFRIMEPGCKLFSLYHFSENSALGVKSNVEGFEHDFSTLREVELRNFHKQIILSIDGEVFHKNNYENSIGEIVGIKIDIKSAGTIDFVELISGDAKVKFRDDF